ncbi:MAG: BTAD domain-containing putative transcriptional regulator [Hyphomicrobiaceae bacterium]
MVRTRDGRNGRPFSPDPEAGAPASPVPSAGVLEIDLFGKMAARCNGRDVVIVGRKARALLGFLAISEKFQEKREVAVTLLWSGADRAHAYSSLRQSIAEIRRAFKAVGYSGFQSDKLSIGFQRASVQVDLAEVLAAARHGVVHDVLKERQKACDAILGEFETVDDEFLDWLLAKRRAISDYLCQFLEERMKAAEASQRQQREAARALFNLDPSHEIAARMLMTAASAEGDIGGALSLYKSLSEHLRATFEAEPSPETQDLMEAIRGDRANGRNGPRAPAMPWTAARPLVVTGGEFSTQPKSPWPTAPRTSGAHQIASKLVISITPFDNSLISEQNHYRVQGFRRELMTCLVRFREWLVCDRAVVLKQDDGSAADHAEYVIEASSIESDGELRLAMTLRDANSDVYLWSERLSLTAARWFEAQELVVRRLAMALSVHVSAERMSAIGHHEPSSLKAYDMWLLAQATLMRMEASSWQKARQLLRHVIRHSPDFAPAYSTLAQLENGAHIAIPGTMRNEKLTEEALGFARHAVHLDPVDSRSQLCLGWSYAMARQYEQSTMHMALAHELNDNDGWTLISSANCLAFCAEYEKSREMSQHALTLPMAPSPLQWSYQTAIRFMIGDYSGCVEAAKAASDHVNPNVPAWKSAALYHLGMKDAAREALATFFSLTRQRWASPEKPTDQVITRWLLHMFPIRRRDDWERLRNGLAGAGAPVAGLKHHGW